MNTLRKLTSSSLLGFVALVGSADAALLTTLPSWDGTFHITALGAHSSTYGQTFRVPMAARLDSWTFYTRDSSMSGESNLVFDVLLTRWSGDRAIGPVLFEFKGLTSPDSDRGQFHELTLNVGGVALEQKAEYVMFLNTSNYPTGLGQKLDLAATPNTYDDGAFWYQLSYNRQANVFDHAWTCADEGSSCRYGDAAFAANTAAVPQPQTPALVILGMATLIARRRSSGCA